MSNRAIFLAFFICWASAAQAGMEGFTTGPAIEKFGPVTDVKTEFPIPAGAVFKHAFDDHVQADPGELNKALEAAARFINMHVRAGVAPENIHLAVIVHGAAVRDVANAALYEKEVGGKNANAELVKALVDHNVRIIVCGQSAAYYDVANDDLLPGVQMALSAMTAHALLQQDGYTLNPF